MSNILNDMHSVAGGTCSVSYPSYTNGYELLSKDLINMQYEMGNVEKNSKNPFFKSTYSSLTEIVNYAKPFLYKHNFAVVQTFNYSDNGTVHINTILIHKSGQSISGTLSMPSKDSTDPQKTGSAITYARRYAYAAILGLTPEEDDDGNKAAGKDNKSQEIRKPYVKDIKETAGYNAAASVALPKEASNLPTTETKVASLILQLQDATTEEDFNKLNVELLSYKSHVSGEQLKVIREVKAKFKS